MALPLIPIIAIAALAMFAGAGKKKRRPTPVPPPPLPNGDIDEGELYAFGLGDFMEGEPLEIDVFPGDMIRFAFAEPVQPAAWEVFTEAIEGAPVLVIEEDRLVPGVDDPEGMPGQYIVDVAVHPGLGVVKFDFMYVETGVDNPAVMQTKQAIVRVV